MPPLLALVAIFVAAGSATAATIRGVVLDHLTGRPLARTLVTLEMVRANGSLKVPVRTASNGQFIFLQLNAGTYLLSASRRNYATLNYGQKSWNTPGVPIIVTEDGFPFLDLRMHQLGTVTGSVWDENEIGLVEQDVYTYLAQRPPVLVAGVRDGMILSPGRWEFTASGSGNQYPLSIAGNNVSARGDAWTEFLIPTRGGLSLKVKMAAGVAGLHGKVLRTLGDAVAGVPVYLEAFDPGMNTRLVDLRKTLTGPNGEYRFSGLTPRSYRVVSSFEFEDPSERIMEAVRASTILLEPGRDATKDLDLYTAP